MRTEAGPDDHHGDGRKWERMVSDTPGSSFYKGEHPEPNVKGGFPRIIKRALFEAISNHNPGPHRHKMEEARLAEVQNGP